MGRHPGPLQRRSARYRPTLPPVLIIERDPDDPTLWHYSLAGGDRLWWAQLRHDPATGENNRTATGPLYDDPYYPTAALLVHQDSTRARIVHDLHPATPATRTTPI